MSLNSCEFFLNYMPKCILDIIHYHPPDVVVHHWVVPQCWQKRRKGTTWIEKKSCYPAIPPISFFNFTWTSILHQSSVWHARGSSITEQGMTVRSEMGRNASRNALSLQLSLWRVHEWACVHQLQDLCPWSYMVCPCSQGSSSNQREQNQTLGNILTAAQISKKKQFGAQLSS